MPTPRITPHFQNCLIQVNGSHINPNLKKIASATQVLDSAVASTIETTLKPFRPFNSVFRKQLLV